MRGWVQVCGLWVWEDPEPVRAPPSRSWLEPHSWTPQLSVLRPRQPRAPKGLLASGTARSHFHCWKPPCPFRVLGDGSCRKHMQPLRHEGPGARLPVLEAESLCLVLSTDRHRFHWSGWESQPCYASKVQLRSQHLCNASSFSRGGREGCGQVSSGKTSTNRRHS